MTTLPILGEKNPALILQLFMLSTFENFLGIFMWNYVRNVKTNKFIVGYI